MSPLARQEMRSSAAAARCSCMALAASAYHSQAPVWVLAALSAFFCSDYSVEHTCTFLQLFGNNFSCCRLYWSDPGMGSIAYIHLNTREKRVLVAAEYSAQLYGITVFQVLTELCLICLSFLYCHLYIVQ